MSLKAKISIFFAVAVMLIFFASQVLIIGGGIEASKETSIFGLGCLFVFIPFFAIIILEVLKRQELKHLAEMQRKNTYLEHASKILRHDMHSGLNTYIPRGIKSLKRRLTDEAIKEYRIEAPLRLIEDGLSHARRVYKGVYEFTDLVRTDTKLKKEMINVKESLNSYLQVTSYKDQVLLDKNLPKLEVNESLFCTAIDNLIRNGLKYNDSGTKMITIKMLDENTLAVIDNGRGMTQEDFILYSKPYLRKENQKEKGSGLGLNITVAILKEHGYRLSVEKLEIGGTMIRIKLK